MPSGSSKKTKRPQGELLDLTDLDPALEQLGPGKVGVGDHQLQSLDASGGHLVGAAGQCDRAGRSRRGQLHEPKLLAHLVVVFGDEADLLVEGLGSIQVGYHLHKLEQPIARHLGILPSQDGAFENLAAEGLGINRTDLDCLNAIENAGGLTAGQLSREVGITTGAVTGAIDRLERAGFARRVDDPEDRRRVKIEVTAEFYARAAEIWGPLAADWQLTLSRRFTAAELARIVEFLHLTNEVGQRHLERLAGRLP